MPRHDLDAWALTHQLLYGVIVTHVYVA